MELQEVLGPTAARLGLDWSTIEPERRALRTLDEYVGAVRSSNKDAAQILVDTAHPNRDPQWIRPCLADEYFRTSAPGLLMATGLLVMLPPGHSSLREAWAYLERITDCLLVDEQNYADMRGWLFGSAAPEVEAKVIKDLEGLRERGESFTRIISSIHEARRAWNTPSGHAGARRDFESQRAALRWHLATLSSDGRELGLRSRGAIDRLAARASQDRFRLAVVGDFR